MSTCRDIIRDAFLENGGLADGDELNEEDGRLGARRLNALLASLAGIGVGEKLRDVTADAGAELEANTRVLTRSAVAYTLPTSPDDGARVQVIGPATLTAPGRRMGALDEDGTLDVAGSGGEGAWLYRADLAAWITLKAPLTLSDAFPYAADTEDDFTSLLAFRLAPTTGVATSQEGAAATQRATASLAARLRQRRNVGCDPAYLRRPTFNIRTG